MLALPQVPGPVRPAGTQPGPTLMGWVLPGLIKNRIGFGFLKKLEAGSGFYKNPAQTWTRPDPTRLNIYV